MEVDMQEDGIRINVRLDAETTRDLRALERYLRNTPSGVVRLAIAELARKYGLAEGAEGEGKAAA
jgi:hypothetical protein